jgi:hypothetical protein
MKLMLFTKRKKVDGFIEPVLLNSVVCPTRSVKYLGVILDAKLTWKEHLKQRISKTYSSSWWCHQTLGKTWGLKPKMMNWLHTGVVRPMLMYAAIV